MSSRVCMYVDYSRAYMPMHTSRCKSMINLVHITIYICTCVSVCISVKTCISRVPNQNGVSLLYIMLEIHHSGQEPLICV